MTIDNDPNNISGIPSFAYGNITFNSVAPVEILVTTDGPTRGVIGFQYGADGKPSPTIGVFNETGVTWTSFLYEGLTLNGGGGGPYLVHGVGGPDWNWSYAPIPVGPGDVLKNNFTFEAPQAGTWEFFAIPNAREPTGAFMPEPPSIVLATSAALLVLAVAFVRARRADGGRTS